MSTITPDRGEHHSTDALKVIRYHLEHGSLKLNRRLLYRVGTRGQLFRIPYHELATSSDSLRRDVLSNRRRLLLWLLKHAYIIYTIVKLLSLALVQFEYDRVRARIWPTSLGHQAAGNRCQPFSSYRHQSSDYEHFMALDRVLSLMGAPLSSLPGACPSGLALIGLLHPFFYYLGVHSLRPMRPRLDLCDFIECRQSERRKFSQELQDLIRALFICECISLEGRKRYIYTFRTRSSSFQTLLGRGQRLTERFNSQREARASEFIRYRIIIESKLHHLIDPAHLSDRFHHMVTRAISAMPKYRVIVCLVPGSVFLIVALCMEISHRVSYRLDVYECHRRGLIPAGAPVQLNAINSSQLHDDAYANYDGSLRAQLELFLLEAGLLLSCWQVLLTIFEALFTMSMATILLPLYAGLYAYECSSKFLWLDQIEHQVNECLRHLTASLQCSPNAWPAQPSHPLASFAGGPEFEREGRHEILRSLTLAYLNFELFRRRQKDYRSLINFLIIQMSLTCAISLTVCYLTCAFISNAYLGVPLTMATYVTALLNVYLVTSAIRTSKAIKLMKNICRMIAFSAENSLNDSRIIKLWSLQLLSQQQTKECFAPTAFGVCISYDKIVAINASLVALWILALGA